MPLSNKQKQEAAKRLNREKQFRHKKKMRDEGKKIPPIYMTAMEEIAVRSLLAKMRTEDA